MNDQQASPSGLYAPVTPDVVHLLLKLSERYRLETALVEYPDGDDKRHRTAREGLKRLGPAGGPERHILTQLAWLQAQLHQRDLDGLKLKDRVNVTLYSENRPSLGCSQWSFTGRVGLIQREQITKRVIRLRVEVDAHRYDLKGVELNDVRPIKAAD